MVEQGWVGAYRKARWNGYARLTRLAEGRPTVVRFAGALAMAAVTAACAQIQLHTPLSPVPYTGQVFAVLLSGALLGSRWGALSQSLYLGLGLVGLPVYAHGSSGPDVLLGLSGGYLLGFILAAAFIGRAAERRTLHSSPGLLLGAPVGLGVLVVLAAVDLAYLTGRPSHLETLGQVDYTSRDALVTLALLLGFFASIGGLVAFAWLRRVQRERLETFLAMVVGVLIIYAVGALVFWLVASGLESHQPVTASKVVELAVVPFVPADLFKAALALGVVAAALPRRAERLYHGA